MSKISLTAGKAIPVYLVAEERTGLLILNTGTPDSPDAKDVRKYLQEFLMDRNVINAPWPVRAMIVHGFVLPRRPRVSSRRYAQIWETDSPLRLRTQEITGKLRTMFPFYATEYAMRYGNPSVASVIRKFREENISRVVVFPLFPHYAMSSYGSAVEHAEEILRQFGIHYTVIPPYYRQPEYIHALSAHTERYLKQLYPRGDWDYLVFSYHSVPVRHLKKTDPTGNHCRADGSCCVTPSPAHDFCYRHQVLETTRLVAEKLHLPQDRYGVYFQSRFDASSWLSPFLESALREMPGRRKKRIAIIAGSFITDGLETLEEINISGREIFLSAGGEEYGIIPPLNAEDLWINAAATIIRKADGLE